VEPKPPRPVAVDDAGLGPPGVLVRTEGLLPGCVVVFELELAKFECE